MIHEGLRFSFDDVQENEKLKEFELQEQKILNDRKIEAYKNSGVPNKFFSESFETFIAENDNDNKIKNAIVEFSKNPSNKVLILYGNNGTGKTHLGSSIIRECGGIYIQSSMLCVKYDSATSFKAKMSREEILDYYSKCKMLVIDECCKYFVNQELEKFLLSFIVSTRYANNVPTVLITNLKKESFIEFMGKAVYDRLTEVCITVAFNGQSKRKERRHDKKVNEQAVL